MKSNASRIINWKFRYPSEQLLSKTPDISLLSFMHKSKNYIPQILVYILTDFLPILMNQQFSPTLQSLPANISHNYPKELPFFHMTSTRFAYMLQAFQTTKSLVGACANVVTKL